jgi:pilus assembly protein CpaE
MSDRIKAVVITKNPALTNHLAEEIRSVVDVVKTVSDHGDAYRTAMEIQPGAVFVDLTEETKKDFELIRRLTRHLAGTSVFILARKKDSDLILEGFRSGVTDYLVFPGSNGSILDAVQKAFGNADGRNGEVVALFSLKGGQGVTSLSVNLADHLCGLGGQKVLLFDLNLYRGDVGAFLNMTSTYTVFDLMKDLDRMDHNLLFSSLVHHPNGFYVLSTPEEVSDADQVNGDDVRRMLALLQRHMDYIVVDMPHDLSERSLAVLDGADTILLVTQQTVQVIKSVQRTLELFQQLSYGEEKVRIVVNRHDRKSDFTAGDLAGIFKQPIFATITNDYQSVMQAINKGRTIGMVRHKSGTNRDMRKLAGLLAGSPILERRQTGWKKTLESLFSSGTQEV